MVDSHEKKGSKEEKECRHLEIKVNVELIVYCRWHWEEGAR